jgi:hypothetical protein
MRTFFPFLLLFISCKGGEITVCDSDGDGFVVASCVTDGAMADCDDGDAEVNPDVDEDCDGVDNDCDGFIPPMVEWFHDEDGDGYGGPRSLYICEQPTGYVADSTDCDDANADVHPEVEDPEDGLDNDCDGEIDEDADPQIDADHDGFSVAQDCDDLNADVNPDADEVCDGLDNDCDGGTDVDASDAYTWYADADQDGYGTDNAVTACTQPAGYAALAGDCDDADVAFNPGAVESDCTDANDYNCDGSSGRVDNDGDGFAACEECDDSLEATHPGAPEFCDGEDNDCNGTIDDPSAVLDPSAFFLDFDHDGFGDSGVSVSACLAPSGYVADATDCDDSQAAVNPDAQEVCDAFGTDEDCDSLSDDADPDVSGQSTWYADADQDGHGDPGVTVLLCVMPSGTVALADDCNDADAAYHPGAFETDCSDPNDYNCDGSSGFADLDQDGSPACLDCDDGNADAFPGGTEVCDGADNNCDGVTDGASEATDTSTFYVDADADGFGLGSDTASACTAPSGYVAISGDCDDARASVNPSAIEVCNSNLDDDCDGFADDADVSVTGRSTFYRDQDADGVGDLSNPRAACTQPTGYVSASTDCADTDAGIHPGAVELCDGVDQDCDGVIDDGTVNQPWYADLDQDGFGDVGDMLTDCAAPTGYVDDSQDCDDDDAAVNPNGVETCNGIDDNCDTAVDEGVMMTYFEDQDGDSYGANSVTEDACTAPNGFVINNTDCNDLAGSINPGAAEVCNGVDDNCAGGVDDGVILTFYRDADGDTYGLLTNTAQACVAPNGFVTTSTDCNDSSAAIHPGATEVCNGTDDNCVSGVDEGVALTFYRDADADTYGGTVTIAACTQPSGYVTTSTDCDDTVTATHPGAVETCNGIDDDCDTQLDEGFTLITWYADTDSDTYRDGSATVQACAQPAGYLPASAGLDCNDTNVGIHPGATESCDGVDQNCDGNVDFEYGGQTWHHDADGDTFGSATDTLIASRCAQPNGYNDNTQDCDDSQASVHPGATELCNGIDDDCAGGVDDNCI